MEVDAMNSKKKISSENTLNIEKLSNISHYVIIKEDILYKLVYRHSTNFPFFSICRQFCLFQAFIHRKKQTYNICQYTEIGLEMPRNRLKFSSQSDQY